ncbi:hypothetical protein AGRA3207_003452 [Actinomadura graeca]|uniref:Peptidase inhibitor family I36 n=1 Tax=Actinomadura graeca TaxID=2750812 RepID=A0ABX8QYC1_9ACTN|nr:hypothetical protein [Actinomadura graeca]QXJ22452.1 hypothetical protein AGRA3207_003452 [Actinomadura graeca]
MKNVNPTNLMKAGALAAMAAAPLMAATTAFSSTPADHVTAVKAPCEAGYVCIYPGNSADGTPIKFKRYGTYNLRNQRGTHLVVNNQTGGAALRLCRAYNGQQCGPRLGRGAYHVNLTPINSIVLER